MCILKERNKTINTPIIFTEQMKEYFTKLNIQIRDK